MQTNGTAPLETPIPAGSAAAEPRSRPRTGTRARPGGRADQALLSAGLPGPGVGRGPHAGARCLQPDARTGGEPGDEPGEGLAQIGLAAVLDLLGCRREALSAALRAERIAADPMIQRLLALALNQQAQYYKETGENRRALTLFERVQAIGVALDDQRLVLAGLIGRGRTTSMAAPDEAIGYYEQAITAGRGIGRRRGVEPVLQQSGRLADQHRSDPAAITLREASLRLSRGWGIAKGSGER